MYIKNILSQNRRDMKVYLECEHCHKGKVVKNAYDDRNYHERVVPNIRCGYCGKTAPDTFKPRQPKYPDDLQI